MAVGRVSQHASGPRSLKRLQLGFVEIVIPPSAAPAHCFSPSELVGWSEVGLDVNFNRAGNGRGLEVLFIIPGTLGVLWLAPSQAGHQDISTTYLFVLLTSHKALVSLVHCLPSLRQTGRARPDREDHRSDK